MKAEFLVERQGKTFALYAGLLDEAHRQGLSSITTRLLQIPEADNGYTAICEATVSLDKDGTVRVFMGIGDAAPNNVKPGMPVLRMAETRSKSRALRDAINFGGASLEEIDSDNDEEVSPAQVHRAPVPTPNRSLPHPAPATPEGDGRRGVSGTRAAGSAGIASSGQESVHESPAQPGDSAPLADADKDPRKHAFVLFRALGAPIEDGADSRAWLSKLLGFAVTSRADLTTHDWNAVCYTLAGFIQAWQESGYPAVMTPETIKDLFETVTGKRVNVWACKAKAWEQVAIWLRFEYKKGDPFAQPTTDKREVGAL